MPRQTIPGVFFAPHNDDETLFGAFTLLKHKPKVVVCLRADRGHADHYEREHETWEAMNVLGCKWEQWTHSASNPDWSDLIAEMRLFDQDHGPERVWAPFYLESGAHTAHLGVGHCALEVFGARVTPYMTYYDEIPYGRHSTAIEVKPAAPEHVTLKLMALTCYQSQIEAPDGYHHFLNEQREYVNMPTPAPDFPPFGAVY